MEADELPDSAKAVLINSQNKNMDVIQAIKERRSINFFETGKDVSDDRLKELMKTA